DWAPGCRADGRRPSQRGALRAVPAHASPSGGPVRSVRPAHRGTRRPARRACGPGEKNVGSALDIAVTMEGVRGRGPPRGVCSGGIAMASDGSITRLIVLLKEGDRAAAQPLWDAYFRRLVGLARARLRGTPRGMADEEDVALSAFDSFCRRAERG